MATFESMEGRGSWRNMQAHVASETSEYCARLQEWMWQYYWQSCMAFWASPLPPSGGQVQAPLDARLWSYPPFWAPVPADGSGSPESPVSSGLVTAGPSTSHGRPMQRQAGSPTASRAFPQALNGQEFAIPTLLHRICAEALDFLILFCMKAAIILTVMHLSGMKDISKLALHFIVEEISEDTSMEELQKMMVVALVYRVLVCFYEIICIWGAGGATPGKFLLGLRIVTCDTAVLIRANRIRVVPASNVSLSASTVRALNKNFSIAFFFPAFITLLFFQHNRTVYDIVAGTIVVKRGGAR